MSFYTVDLGGGGEGFLQSSVAGNSAGEAD